MTNNSQDNRDYIERMEEKIVSAERAGVRLTTVSVDDLRSLLSDVERMKDSNQGLEADLFEAVSVAYRRGAVEWTRLNYPKCFERIEANEQARQAFSAEEGE